MTYEVELVRQAGTQAIATVNEFNRKVFRTRGGRLGSGMGLLLEGLWGYHTNSVLLGQSAEIAWIVDHDYNDFAVVDINEHWDPSTRAGEFFRVEIKAMNVGADESKAHFDEISRNIGALDELVVLAWGWEADGDRVWPKITDWFMGNAREIASLRDALHLARGGSFVQAGHCPDGCDVQFCSHVGEPLNKSGTRERISGPVSAKGANVSFAANFGGLGRMVKARGSEANQALATARHASQDAADYLNFIDRLKTTE